MKKLIMAAIVVAASAQPAAASAGPYFGVQIAAAQVTDEHTDVDGWYNAVSQFGMDKTGAIGGVHAGYDAGNGSLIAGVLAEVNFGKLDTYAETSPKFTEYAIGSRTTMLGSARAKLGIRSGSLTAAINGGFAFSNATHKYFETDGSRETFNDKGSRSGWVAGFGFDYAVSPHTSIGLSASQYQFAARDHVVLNSAGTPYDCSRFSTASDGKCHFVMRDQFKTLAASYRYHF